MDETATAPASPDWTDIMQDPVGTAMPPASTAPQVSNAQPGAQADAPPTVQAPLATRQGPAAPAAQGPADHSSFFSNILHAIGDVFGGPKTAQRVNPQTGAIENVPLSTRQRIAGGIGTALVGAAAGAAQHGPGATGKAALAGVQAEQEQQQRQKQNILAQSENVRETNRAQLEKQTVQLNLAKMSQEQAKNALEMKIKGMELDEHQTALANSMQEILNAPGAKLLQHFDSNDEINKHLETVGPQLSKQYAIDLARNNIRLVQNPKGGFDAVEVPKQAGEQPIGEGHYLQELAPDPKKPGQLMLIPHPADPMMTLDHYMQFNGGALSAYNSAQEQQTKIAEQQSAGQKDIAEAAEAYAGKQLKLAQAKNLEGGMAKNDDGSWNPASVPVALVEGNMDPTQMSKRGTDYNAKIQQANQYSMDKYGKPFDLAQAQSDYKYATQSANQNTLKMINGMVEPGGAIDIAKGTATALPKLPEQTLNKVFNAAATEFGSSEATNFHTAMLGLADEYSKVMGGGVSSDTGRQQSLDILKSAYSQGQISGAIQTMQRDIAARKAALIGNNRYLIKQYGASQAGPPPGATHVVPGPDGRNHYTNAQGTLDLGVAP